MKYTIKKSSGLITSHCPTEIDLCCKILNDGANKSSDNELSHITRFHVDNNDYLGTTATVIDLYLQKKDTSKMRKALEKIRDDLMHLQRNYKLVKKIAND